MSYTVDKYLTRDLFNPVEFIAAFRAVFDLLKGSYHDLLIMFIVFSKIKKADMTPLKVKVNIIVISRV